MLIKMIALMVVVSTSHQTCNSGCLKCDPRNRCILSDSTHFYKLVEDYAVLATLPKCLIMHIDGYCQKCETGYYPDLSTKKCVRVPDANLISNCETYLNYTSCLACAIGYYLSDNTCLPAKNVIANCDYYANDGVCGICKQKYITYFDGSKCISPPMISNCGHYSFLKCQSCSQEYLLNLNTYIYKVLDNQTITEQKTLTSFMNLITVKEQLFERQDICQLKNTPNCSKFNANIGNCLVCESGFYLDSSNYCRKFPAEPIENCLNYFNSFICLECQQGYRLENNICLLIDPNKKIDKCASYSGSSSEITCELCESAYFLLNNTCKERSNFAVDGVKNCKMLQIDADLCSNCENDFYLTVDKLDCISLLANCKEYNPTSSNQELSCLSCESGYMLKLTKLDIGDSSECAKGLVENCDVYNDNIPDKCVNCKNGYFNNSGACTAQNIISDCVQYSNSVPNTCITCDKSLSFNFVVENSCQMVVYLIENCVKYISGTVIDPVCGECSTGFYLLDNKCLQIPIANCLATSGDGCTACKKNFAISSNKIACSAALLYVSDRCLVLSTAADVNKMFISDATCLTCKEHAVPVAFQNLFGCISITNILQFNVLKSATDACLKYDTNVDCIQCDPSSGKPYLNTKTSPPTCVASCTSVSGGTYSKMVLKLSTNRNNTVGEILQYNVCFSSSLSPNCLVYAPNLASNGEQICIWCTDAAIPVVSLSNKAYTNVDPLETVFESYIPSAFVRFPQVTCSLKTSIVNMNGSPYSVLPLNCRYYQKIDATSFACIKCRHNYTSAINSAGYIYKCTQDMTCVNKRIYNLDGMWSLLTTCHACAVPEFIPFIMYSSVSVNDPTFVKYDRWALSLTGRNFIDSTGVLKNMFCTLNSNLTFGLSSKDYGVDPNCGIGAVIVNTNGIGDNDTQFGTFCTACKPGFSAVSHPKYPFIKTSCSPIASCADNSSYFNACSNCKPGSILTIGNSFDFTKCQDIPSASTIKFKNCFTSNASRNQTYGTANQCEVCNTGYHLNSDGYCDKYIPNLCLENKFSLSTPRSTRDWDWSLWISGGPPGCNKCSASSRAIQMKSAINVCVYSTWVAELLDNATESRPTFIPRCKNYAGNSSSLSCKACDPGYVINGDSVIGIIGKICYPDDYLKNCSIASSHSACISCISDQFGLSTGLCIIGNINKCKSYNYNKNSPNVICERCNGGYYFDSISNKCLDGSVDYCSEYENDNPGRCITCQLSYVILEIADNRTNCFKKDSTFGCDAFSVTNHVSGGNFKCLSCINPSKNIAIAQNDDANKTVCLGFNQIVDCKVYNVGATLATSTFDCIECITGYYVLANKCRSRAFTNNKCLDYAITEDKCLRCDATSYLPSNGLSCTDYPDGIIGCKEYATRAKCIECQPGRYLLDNKCIRVLNPIDNCKSYSADGICSNCTDSYVLENKTCEMSLAFNCASYMSRKECGTCAKGYVLHKNVDVVSCESKFLDGCDEIDTNYPHDCLKCFDECYLDNGRCGVPAAIPFCIIYSSKTTCSKCERGYFLAVDKLSCIDSPVLRSLSDPECEDATLLSVPICSKCAAGYYFVDGACQGSCNPAGRAGCMICNPADLSYCYLCSPGYYMIRNGTCVLKLVRKTSSKNSVKVRSVFILLLVVIMTAS